MTSAEAEALPEASDTRGGQLSHGQILRILGGLMLGLFLAALDQTIVASAIRTIGDDLHGLSVQAWVTTAYLITSTISTPLYGKLSDIYGRKQFFLAAISIFIVGSALCSFATSMYMLAGFRALQGIGAGGLFSLALAILGDIVPPRARAKYQGYFLAVFGTSSVLGPVIGGTFAGQSSILGITGWRWVFLVNVPIGFIALVVVARTLNLPHSRREHRLDYLGAVFISVGLVPLLTVAEQGRTWGWGSGRSLACYVIGVVGIAAFVWTESRMGEDALIPVRFFRNRTFALTSVVAVVIGMGLFGGISALPLYLQIVRGATPTRSGLELIPLTLGIMLGSVISGQVISRTGRYKIFPVVGSALMIVGMVLLHFIGATTPYWQTGVCMLVFGLGLGNVLQPITLAVQNAMPPQDIGVATSSSTFFRQMGGALGVAIFLSVLFSTVGGNIKSAFDASAKTPAPDRDQRPGGAGQPREQAGAGRPAGPRQHRWRDDQRHVIHPAPRQGPGAAVPGRVLNLDGPRVPGRRRGAGPRLRHADLPARDPAADPVRHGGSGARLARRGSARRQALATTGRFRELGHRLRRPRPVRRHRPSRREAGPLTTAGRPAWGESLTSPPAAPARGCQGALAHVVNRTPHRPWRKGHADVQTGAPGGRPGSIDDSSGPVGAAGSWLQKGAVLLSPALGDRYLVLARRGGRLQPAAPVVVHVSGDDLDHGGHRNGEQGAQYPGELHPREHRGEHGQRVELDRPRHDHRLQDVVLQLLVNDEEDQDRDAGGHRVHKPGEHCDRAPNRRPHQRQQVDEADEYGNHPGKGHAGDQQDDPGQRPADDAD